MGVIDDQFPLKQFLEDQAEIKRRLDVLERPTGTSVGSLVAQVQAAIVNIGASVTAFLSGGFSTNGNITAPNGTLISLYARNHSVVTGYVALYVDINGNVLATPSRRALKRDIETATWTPEQWRGIRVAFYQLRSAYILADMQGQDPKTLQRLVGVIGEELLALGLDEFVVLDKRGHVFTVHYELMGLVAIDAAQQLAVRADQADARADAMEKRLAALEKKAG
jgi:hypothetical protein